MLPYEYLLLGSVNLILYSLQLLVTKSTLVALWYFASDINCDRTNEDESQPGWVSRETLFRCHGIYHNCTLRRKYITQCHDEFFKHVHECRLQQFLSNSHRLSPGLRSSRANRFLWDFKEISLSFPLVLFTDFNSKRKNFQIGFVHRFEIAWCHIGHMLLHKTRKILVTTGFSK